MLIHHFFDNDTATFTYVVADSKTKKCAIIDAVLDFDMPSGRIVTHSADKVLEFIQHNHLEVEWILETHAHADHLTAAQYLKDKVGGRIAIGEHIKDVQQFWMPLFNCSGESSFDGSQFDHLFKDEETFYIGTLPVRVMHTPGHTPACVTYLIEDAAFVGDTLFMPYVGTARTDFPGGSANQLYRSIQKILSLPENTRLFTCHDYPPSGQDPDCLSTVGAQKKHNIMVKGDVSEEAYVIQRLAKDKGKPVPRLLLPSIQVNILAGKLSEPEANGIRYLKIPLNSL
ncbi:metallo-beta-lactamase family transporter protein [Legionella moravica]|uniref:Hydroxyacylglutathione hydrolase n=1 Tax=Legionella moravica TaxID=39962 RepID=A0A378JWQ8_9GAMM|nr:MBL fold metallo-hydrolase [Legionella moravica]KTD37378.1 metallo-beta-lactamase family transporter protein [Legionella moravica]STX63145.1 hydroxyacylglutathione hydrolase [Legionella moravica]